MTHNTILHAIILGSIALGVFLEARTLRQSINDPADEGSDVDGDVLAHFHNDNAGAA